MNPTELPSPESGEGEAWLDGLAGRATDSTAAKEGSRLRGHLLASAELPAGAPPDLASLLARHEAPPQGHRWAWAAVLVMACGVGWWQMVPQDDVGMRGAGGSAEFQWMVETAPQASADELARALRQLGAEVRVAPQADGVLVQVSAPAAARDAVNQRLAVLEAALDQAGHCRILVRR